MSPTTVDQTMATIALFEETTGHRDFVPFISSKRASSSGEWTSDPSRHGAAPGKGDDLFAPHGAEGVLPMARRPARLPLKNHVLRRRLLQPLEPRRTDRESIDTTADAVAGTNPPRGS